MKPPLVVSRFSPGEVVAEKYRVVGVLGTGGFGQVFAAENLNLGTHVAIKVPRTPGADASAWREARAAARLRSPHTVRILDVDDLPDGTPYIVMELLEGQSLRQYLNQHERAPWQQALDWTRQLCIALKEAHAIRLVHRDLKPSNIFLVNSPDSTKRVKLLDFGLAKALDAAGDESTTESGTFAGSPAYMSPEQVRGLPAAAASDIWSIGVVLYEMLSGTRPFAGEGTPALFASIVADQPTPLAELCPDLPAPLGALTARCLRKAPHERVQSIDLLEREIDELCADASSRPDSNDDDTESGLASPPSQPSQLSQPRFSRWPLFGVPVLLAAATAGLFLTTRELPLPNPIRARPQPTPGATRVSQPERAEPALADSAVVRDPSARPATLLPSALLAPASPRTVDTRTRPSASTRASTRAPERPASQGPLKAVAAPPKPTPTFFDEPDF